MIVRFVKGSKIPAEQRETKGQKNDVNTEVKVKITARQLSLAPG